MQPIASWQTLSTDKFYAGELFPNAPQWFTHIGLTINRPNERNLSHDRTQPMPIPAESIAVYQAEDAFEHIAYDAIGPIFEDIYRVLKIGGLFRLSVPDCRCDNSRDRSVIDATGDVVLNPGGGGRFENGAVMGGSHVWFPLYEL